ncbi:hypothetical protein KO529_04680 [Arenibacter algicola]|uniref:hypothetical protein n=1 Tax=Arenibacter algicola TaxID=616991 RepID=UPI001C0668E5|nr:hypothetical protein [Arenibacter algicola]MBU2904071.1 hypothetical protein [Arenibacter algicola]
MILFKINAKWTLLLFEKSNPTKEIQINSEDKIINLKLLLSVREENGFYHFSDSFEDNQKALVLKHINYPKFKA